MKRKKITLTKPADSPGYIPLTQFIVIVVLAVLIITTPQARADDISAGFLFDRFSLTLEDGNQTEAAGPFYYFEQTGSENVLAFPPFFSRDRIPSIDYEADDFLYPLFTRTHYGQERRWQFCELLNTSSGQEPGGEDVKQFTLFPIYFQQRSADTNLDYTAVLPFYGHLAHRLFRDEIFFIMFPAYVKTRKGDLVTDNYFFPFGDVHHADGLEGWQVWPFAGREHKDVTTRTNGFGDVSVVAGHDRSFYLWPFYFSQDNGLGTTNQWTLRASIPLYVITRSPQRDSTSVLWPLFAWIDDRDRLYHEWQGPWPFVIFTRGEGKHTSRVWPLFSQSHNATEADNSYLWPLYLSAHTQAGTLDKLRQRVLFYLYSRLAIKNTGSGKERVRVDMWPFLTWRHEFNGNERLQILAPLEPFVPDNPGIERNWSPLWSFWRAEQNPATGASSQSLFWNLYRRENSPAQTRVSCLFGLFQYQARTDGKSLRLFYLPPMSRRKN